MGFAVLGVLLLVAAGCGSSHRAAQAATLVRVTERDFHISAPKRVSSGDLRLSVSNHGPDNHELIVVRANGPRLPLRTDGVTVNEETLERATVGVLEPGQPGSVRQLSLHLAPGRYELLCNMAGHYLGGMHAELVVE